MANKLREEILALEKTLNEKRKILFLNRLEAIAECRFKNSGITDMSITFNQQDNTWQISYLHKTQNFNFNDYSHNNAQDIHDLVEDAQELEEEVKVESSAGVPKETRIIFGKSSKYFIRGGIKYNIYRNTTGELRITNPEYEFDLDLDQQRSLVCGYSENHNLPEWFAIKTLLYLSDNKWDDQSFINHLSIV